MKQTERKYLTVGLLLLAFGLPSPIWAQIYRWEDERGVVHMTDDPRKIPEKDRGRVEVIPLPESKEGAVPSPPLAEAPEAMAPSGQADAQGHDRAWWQGQMKKWREKKSEAERQLAEAKGRLNRILMSFPSIARRQKEAEIREEIKEYEEQIQEAARMLSEVLPEEARKAGAPPGWLRESP